MEHDELSRIGWNQISKSSQMDPAEVVVVGSDVKLEINGYSMLVRPDLAAEVGAKLIYAGAMAGAIKEMEDRTYNESMGQDL